MPAGIASDLSIPEIDPLKYQDSPTPSNASTSKELLTLKLRYKQPQGDKSTALAFGIEDRGQSFGSASADFKFASAVAAFGMLLRNSKYKGNMTYDGVLEIANEGAVGDRTGYRREFLELAQRAKQIASQ